MLSLANGTSVPKSLDPPDLPPNFNVAHRLKSPVTAITLTYLGDSEWEVYFFRDRKTPKKYSPSISLAAHLANVILNYKFSKFVDITPELRGWTAYVDRAVYPPPKVRNDEPEQECEACEGTGFCFCCFGSIDDHIGPPKPACYACGGLGTCSVCDGTGNFKPDDQGGA